jgi:hypothetical protein
VLDVGLRLEKLLKRAGYTVVMTRRDDRFIPLEQRTAIANRELADLFLSIHANAGRNPQARGVETYFLNFATNPDAIAVAARENASSAQAMHNLPDIVRAITLNTKIDESRDFAIAVQKSMVKRLRAPNPGCATWASAGALRRAHRRDVPRARRDFVHHECAGRRVAADVVLPRSHRRGAVRRRLALPAVAEGRGGRGRPPRVIGRSPAAAQAAAGMRVTWGSGRPRSTGASHGSTMD